MSPAGDAAPRLLVVGGCAGLVGRAVLAEFGADHRIRSVHRHPSEAEARAGVETRTVDAGAVADWTPYLEGVDTVLTLAWYREPRGRRFRRLGDALVQLVKDAERSSVRRFVHVSVPDAPVHLETGLPYLVEKRRVDRAIAASALDYVIVRPTMLFGPRDKLLTVMLRTVRRYHRFPMFGDGEYHLSPISTTDLAAILRREGDLGGRRDVPAGGPRRWKYRDLTDEIFRAAGLPPRYVRFSPSGSVRLARFLELVGSSILYAYEVEWLLADMLGLPAYAGLDHPLRPVELFLASECGRPATTGGSDPPAARAP